jgi:hypothetical protein
MYSLRYVFYSSPSPGELSLINILRPVVLNFGNDLHVLSKILKGSCTDVTDTGLFLVEEEAISESGSSLLTEGT